MAPLFTGLKLSFGAGAGGVGVGIATFSTGVYYPLASPTTTTSFGAPGFQISTPGSYGVVFNSMANLPFIMWGSGGSPGGDAAQSGGAGGCAQGNLIVTAGTTYTFVVGAVGDSSSGGVITRFNGDPTGPGAVQGGPGGGYSGLFEGPISQANARLIAGGGGGSSGTESGDNPGARGGGGGGTTGNPGTGTGNSPAGGCGGGGTQSAGGSPGPSQPGPAGGGNLNPGGTGAALLGGMGGMRSNPGGGGGGGGGGYWGGGGGGNGGWGNRSSGGNGGGGSGYLHPSITLGTLSGASPDNVTAGNSPSPLRGTSGNPGTPGIFILRS
jgi:hypothetical protein